VAEQFNASTQSGLGIDGQTVGIQQYNRFEISPMIGLYMGLGKEFEILADKLDPLSVRTFDTHDMFLHLFSVIFIDFLQECV
jgi:hypothetical protein